VAVAIAISAPAQQQLWPWHQDGVAISPSMLCWFLLLVGEVSATEDFLVHGNTAFAWCCCQSWAIAMAHTAACCNCHLC